MIALRIHTHHTCTDVRPMGRYVLISFTITCYYDTTIVSLYVVVVTDCINLVTGQTNQDSNVCVMCFQMQHLLLPTDPTSFRNDWISGV
jgi:hypothetical protein